MLAQFQADWYQNVTDNILDHYETRQYAIIYLLQTRENNLKVNKMTANKKKYSCLFCQNLIRAAIRYIRLVNGTHAIVLVQAGMQANQLTRAIDHTSNITDFTKNHTGKSFFFP